MDTWDHFTSWQLVLPPSRPSAEQLRVIRDRVADIDRTAPVAVLGSTPEFRDLFWECGFRRICVLDRNLRFHELVSRERVYKNPEKVLEGDWFSVLPRHKEFFAVILSDLTSGNIPYDRRAEFYGYVADSLMSGGMFFDKILTHTGPHLAVEALIEKYAKLPLNLLYINYFSCEMLFISELLDLEEMVDTTRFYALLDQRISNERVRAFVAKSELITPRGCNWHYGRRWELLAKHYCVGLKQVADNPDEVDSPYFGRVHRYWFRKD